MKIITSSLILSLLIGCGQKENKEGAGIDDSAAGKTDEVVFHPIIDSKTKDVFAMIPLPANWRVNNNNESSAMIDGPDGIRVFSFPLRFFLYTDDPYFQQLYSQSGQPVRRPVPVETIVSEDLLPVAKNEGSTFIRQYSVADIAKADRDYDAMLFKVVPSQQSFDAVVTEWEDAKGNPYLIVIHQNSSYANNLVNWGYYCHAMEASKEGYEQAKKNFLYGLANTRYNPKNVEAYNIREAQKANASMAAHNQRMAVRQQQFEASQRAFESKRDMINTAITENYNNANAASDRNHNRFLNYIKDENTISANGKRYQVESGSNQYWTNGNGEYIGSNNPNYDPNRNQDTNNQTWTEAQIEQ